MENLNPTDLEQRLKDLVERAEKIENCLVCRKCDFILEGIRGISEDARNRLVLVDPTKTTEIIQLQQTAKAFDVIAQAISNAVTEGHLALDQLNQFNQGD